MTDPLPFPGPLNRPLLERLQSETERRFGVHLQRILAASAEHGVYGQKLLDTLHDELPRTSCENCGACCNAVSIFSLEYHLIVRDLMTRFPPDRLRSTFHRAWTLGERLAEIGESGTERRLRCSFRDNDAKVCLIHPARPFACRFYGLLKEDGTRDCNRVLELTPSPPLTSEQVIKLQERVLTNSESFEVFPGSGSIAFFPFEFWMFRYAFGPAQALRIYREVLVPASTPLTEFWKNLLRESPKLATPPARPRES